MSACTLIATEWQTSGQFSKVPTGDIDVRRVNHHALSWTYKSLEGGPVPTFMDARSKACSRSWRKSLSGDSHLTVMVILLEMIGGLNG
jgi:hypothetical protein